MANPSKKKGTGGETELLRRLDILGLVRTPPASKWDLEYPGQRGRPSIEVLATRPDNGRWLMTMTLDDFELLREGHEHAGLRIEVKRYAKFAHHSIFEGKFGRK